MFLGGVFQLPFHLGPHLGSLTSKMAGGGSGIVARNIAFQCSTTGRHKGAQQCKALLAWLDDAVFYPFFHTPN